MIILIFAPEVIDKDEKISIHFVQIENLTSDLKNYINEHLLEICRGENHINELKYIKKQLVTFFENKDENKIHGSLGELFSHFYFKSSGFNPRFMFLNLEENSLKKGFDGFYEREGIVWILDSKSGRFDSKDISHRSKVLEAYNSLNKQVGGETRNNPWENAFQHANSRDINSTTTLLETIRSFSNNYLDKKYVNLETQNIILASTIYWYDEWEFKKVDEVLDNLENVENNFKFLNLIIFCCNQQSYKEFLNYLGDDTNGDERKVSTNAS